MRISRIVFLLGFNMVTTFAYSATPSIATKEVSEALQNLTLAPEPIEQTMIINRHTLETVEPGKSMEEVQAARAEMMRSLMILIDSAFEHLGGIPLNLISDKPESLETQRVLFNTALNILLNDIKDPAATAIGLEKMDFFQAPPSCHAKTFLMNFMNISPAPNGFNKQSLLLKGSCSKRANNNKNNTITARHLWSIGWAESLLATPWDALSPQQQTDVQDLSDSGSTPFQYLRAFYLFKDKTLNGETLDINERMRKLADLGTDAGHDFWRTIQWYLLSTNKIPEAEAKNEWFEFFIAIATNNLPLSQSLAFTPIEKSRDSTTWPMSYKETIYSMTSATPEEPLRDVLRVLAEEVRTVEAADLYLKDFLSESTIRNPENNDERITEVDRICSIVPGAKQIIADAICQFDKPLFTTEILLDLGLATPAERLQKLHELSDQGIERASFYLATAYSDSLHEGTPLVTHLGIQSRESLPAEERTFGNLAQIHKENAIKLIRLALKGNKLAQHFLLEKPQGTSFRIIEKLFDDRLALSGEKRIGSKNLGPTPCGSDQHNMNQMLTHALRYAFNVANILYEKNDVPEFFYEQIRRRFLTA